MLSNPSELTSQTGTMQAPSHWSPQQQTARMLALCEAQMEAATQDSDQAVDTLVQAFTELVSIVRDMGKLTNAPTPAAEESAAAGSLEEINQRCTALSNQVAAAIVAFQFYDKLSQRLGHVRYSLSTLALFICDRMNSQKPEHWEKLLLTLGRLYRTTEERAIFDSIAGSLALTSSEAIRPLSQANSHDGSIELF
jgi:hypothetical protein